MDLVVTVPKLVWADWLAEGDCAGEPASGQEWSFFLGQHRPPIAAGERLYVASWGRVRGYAPVTRVAKTTLGWCICREGGAVAVTIPAAVPGFRGWRLVWWDEADEIPYPDWRSDGVPTLLSTRTDAAPAVTVYTDAVHLFLDADSWVLPDDSGRWIGHSALLQPLHAFADRIGLRREWLHASNPRFPHYDLTTPAAAARAIGAGALLVNVRDTAVLARPTGSDRRPPDWRPRLLDPAEAAQLNTKLLRMFAPKRALGRRGTAHLVPTDSTEAVPDEGDAPAKPFQL